MFEILTTVMLSIMAIASPTLPYDYHSYTAKASSLNEAVLAVGKIPEIANAENGGELLPQTITERETIISLIQQTFGQDWRIMTKIADCESIGLRHYVKDEVLRGEAVKEDIGLFQINETYWLEKSKELEIDIYDLEGNIKMARYIYDTQGLSAWSASFKNCWKNI